MTTIEHYNVNHIIKCQILKSIVIYISEILALLMKISTASSSLIILQIYLLKFTLKSTYLNILKVCCLNKRWNCRSISFSQNANYHKRLYKDFWTHRSGFTNYFVCENKFIYQNTSKSEICGLIEFSNFKIWCSAPVVIFRARKALWLKNETRIKHISIWVKAKLDESILRCKEEGEFGQNTNKRREHWFILVYVNRVKSTWSSNNSSFTYIFTLYQTDFLILQMIILWRISH